MPTMVQRRDVLTSLGAGLASLSGCVGSLPGSGDGVDRTIFVGAYHWGFVILDESGQEQERISLQRGDILRLVAFNTSANRAVQSLSVAIRESLPDHEALEERNEERIPPPPDGDLHELLEEVNERYPDHSLAIMATYSLVIPIEPSAKGKASIRGLESVVGGLQEQLQIEIGVLAAIPIRFKETRDQREMLDALEYSAPVVIGDRTSLMEGCWKQQCSAFRYVREFRDRTRDYEIKTLAQYDELARHLEGQAQLDTPHPPEPGSLEIAPDAETTDVAVSR